MGALHALGTCGCFQVSPLLLHWPNLFGATGARARQRRKRSGGAGGGIDGEGDDDADEESESLLEMGPPSVMELAAAAAAEEAAEEARDHVEHHHWRAYRHWEKFWAPFFLNVTNGGLLVSMARLSALGLYVEVAAYGFLLVASIALHTYRDWPHLMGRRARPSIDVSERFMRIDFAAAFNLCGVVWVYQTAYGSTHPYLSQPVLYAANLALAVLLAAGKTDRMAVNGTVMTVFGILVALPSMVMDPAAYNWAALAAAILIQNVGFVLLLFAQYHVPYWIAHSLWHVLGCTATYVMISVRNVPPPPTADMLAAIIAPSMAHGSPS